MESEQPIQDIASQQSQQVQIPEMREQSRGGFSKKMIVYIGVILFIILLAGGGYYLVQQGKAEDESTREVFVETSELAPTSTEEEEKEFEKSSLSIQVLNGSGIEGAAGEAQEILEDADYVVEETANASNYNYRTTEIQRKESVPDDVIEELEDILTGDVKAREGDELDEDEDYDIIVIVGGEREVVEEDDSGDVLGESDESTTDESSDEQDENDEESSEDENESTPTPSPTPEE